MATTLTIPLTTLSSQQHFAVSIPTGLTSYELDINRNVGTNPIDGLPANQTALTIAVEVSLDGGTTWQPDLAATVAGGVITPSKGPGAGSEATVTSIGSSLPGNPNSTQRHARATITPASTVSISGSLILS